MMACDRARPNGTSAWPPGHREGRQYHRPMLAVVRLVHPAPAAAVIVLSATLAAILSAGAGRPLLAPAVVLTVAAIAGSQVLTGALNDWADRERDAGRRDKPIPAGQVTPAIALALAAAGGVLQLAASVPLGVAFLGLGAVASAAAVAYDLWLSRTPLSVVPYLIAFGVLPAWIAVGVGAPIERVAGAIALVGPFAAAAHLANALRDFDTDAARGSRNLAQVLGRRRSHRLASGLALAVGAGVGAAMIIGGSAGPLAIGLGVVGLGAVGVGAVLSDRLWFGILAAAVAWSASWALATG
jgi:4-hydroxybenzoate polyprenyltransferase